MPRSLVHALTLLAAAFGGLVGVSCSRNPEPEDLLARVGTRELRVSDLRRELSRRSVPGRPAPEAGVVLEDLIQRESMLQRARALGLDRDPALVRSFENLLIAGLKERELEPRLKAVEATPDEVAAELRARNRGPATGAAEVRRLAVLFLEVPVSASESARARAAARLEQARAQATAPSRPPAPSGFGPLAVEYSDDQATRYRGGDIGWVKAGAAHARLDPEVIAAGFALARPGDVSDVIRTARGYHLVRFMEAAPTGSDSESSPRTVAAAEAGARTAVLQRKRRALESGFGESVRGQVRVDVHPDAVRRLLPVLASGPAPTSEPPAAVP